MLHDTDVPAYSVKQWKSHQEMRVFNVFKTSLKNYDGTCLAKLLHLHTEQSEHRRTVVTKSLD